MPVLVFSLLPCYTSNREMKEVLHMALMSEFQEERDAVLKHGTWKQKAAYIWEYYKWHIIIPIVVIIAIVSFIINVITAPDILLNGVMLNVFHTEASVSTDELLTDFYKKQEIDSKEEKINLNTSLYYSVDDISGNYQSLQALMAWHGAGQLDFLSGDVSALTDLAYRSYFIDLRECLTEEQIAAYEPYFLYIDYDFLLERSEKVNNMEDVSSLEYPDSAKPEEMSDPIPVMIDMTQSKKLNEVYDGLSDTLAFGITSDKEHKEMVSAFLDYLMEIEE